MFSSFYRDNLITLHQLDAHYRSGAIFNGNGDPLPLLQVSAMCCHDVCFLLLMFMLFIVMFTFMFLCVMLMFMFLLMLFLSSHIDVYVHFMLFFMLC